MKRAYLHHHSTEPIVPSDQGEFRRSLWAAQSGRCSYCGTRIRRHSDGKSSSDATLDHVMPVSLGGDGRPANLVYACRTCNEEKGDMHPAEWFAQIGRGWDGPMPRPSVMPVRSEAAPAVILYRPEPGEVPTWAAARAREVAATVAAESLRGIDLASLRAERDRLLIRLADAEDVTPIEKRLAKVNARIRDLAPPPNPPGTKARKTAVFYVGAAWSYVWPREVQS